MGEAHQLEREAGGLLSFVIDDKMGAARSLEEACYRCLTGVMMMAALGIFFSPGKCELWPVQLLRWLGMQLQTVPSVFYSIPEDKLRALHALVVELQQQRRQQGGEGGGTLPRRLARLAGMLVSVTVATPLPRLLERALYLVLRERTSWRAVMPLPMQLDFFLRWMEPMLRPGADSCLNGRCWLKAPKPPAQLQLVADTSEAAHAGCVLEGGSVVEKIQVTFTAEQRAATLRQEWGSTPREMKGLRLCCDCLGEQPHLMQRLQHTRLQIICDSQGTIQALEKLVGSSWEQLSDVAAVWRWLLQWDISPAFVWRPRDSAEVVPVDALSKQQDQHDVHLCQQQYEALCSRQLPPGQQQQVGSSTWGRPVVDLFASARAHKCSRYYTAYLSPGAAGADAFSANWGREGLAFIFAGPLYPAGRLVSKVMHDWEALLVGRHVRDRWDLGFWEGLYEPGPLLPARLHGMRVPLVAYRIEFS